MSKYFLVQQGGYDDMSYCDEPAISTYIGEYSSDEEAAKEAVRYLESKNGRRKFPGYSGYISVDLVKKVTPFEYRRSVNDSKRVIPFRLRS